MRSRTEAIEASGEVLTSNAFNKYWRMSDRALDKKLRGARKKAIAEFDDVAPRLRKKMSEKRVVRHGCDAFPMVGRFSKLDKVLRLPDRFLNFV